MKTLTVLPYSAKHLQKNWFRIRTLWAFKDSCMFGARVRKTVGTRSCCIPELLALKGLSLTPSQPYREHVTSQGDKSHNLQSKHVIFYPCYGSLSFLRRTKQRWNRISELQESPFKDSRRTMSLSRSLILKSLGEQPHQSTMCLYWHLQPCLRRQLVRWRLLSTESLQKRLFCSTVWKKDWNQRQTLMNQGTGNNGRVRIQQ